METVAFCEIDPFCQVVLRKNWPSVRIHDDITKLDARDYAGSIDVICGGFPCQDLSSAGKQEGIYSGRSGLWAEMFRLISDIRPRYALIENVTGLLTGERGQWFSRLLSDLASVGYDAEWHCIRASRVGLPHHRDRVWIIAYPTQERPINHATLLNHAAIEVAWQAPEQIVGNTSWKWLLANGDMRDYRKDNGLPEAAYRVGSLGNSVVPKIPHLIGNAIMAYTKNNPAKV
jgi:DNA (cytosine-5)-methyltransferase 1